MKRAVVLLALVVLTGCFKKPPTSPVPGGPVDRTAPPPTRTETVGAAALPIDDRIEDAASLLDTQHPSANERAVTILQGVLAEDPDNAIAWLDLGVAQYQDGDSGGARRSWGEAIERDETLGEAWLYLGYANEQVGRTDLAISDFRTGLLRDPDNVDLRAALVASLRRQGRLDEAVTEAKAGLAIDAHALPIYNDLGLVYLQKGDIALAKFVYQKALNSVEGASTSAIVHANLGWAFWLDGDEPTARYYLERAVELDPELVPGLVYLSRVYLADRNYADTVPMLERALADQPDNHGVIVNLGIAYRGVGRYADAEAMYRRALELQPRNPDPWFDLGVLLGDHLKRYDDGIAALNKYVSAGGAERDLAVAYVADLEKERERAEKKKQAEDERAARDAARSERERLLEEPAPAPQSPWGDLEKDE